MESDLRINDRARAYPASDAQGQHPAPARNGRGLLRHQGRAQRKRLVRPLMDVRLRCVSLNVGTMTGRARELAAILKKRRVNVACLQETKWKGTKSREIGEGYKFYYCGNDGKRNGVGVVIDSRLKECVTDVKRVNDRLICVKVMLQNVILNIVSVYAPQAGCDDRVKEMFWEEFDCMVMDIPECEEIYMGGDFNGHVGRSNEGYERVHGGWGFGTRNKTGDSLLQAASSFDLAIVNTFFQKKDEHLITYKSGQYSTQIDFFLVRRKKLNCVKNCKVIPGEELVSQHRLLLLEVTIRVKKSKVRERPPPKIKWYLLEKNEYACEFRKRMGIKMLEMQDMMNKPVNDCWNEMAGCIRREAKDVLGESKGKGKIDRDTWWWNEKVQDSIKEKKRAFKEWQNANERDESMKNELRLVYKECKKNAKRAVAKAKAEVQEELFKSLDTPNGQKQLFRIAKSRQKQESDVCKIKCIKDGVGRVLSDDCEIRERWKEYFERLMNEEFSWSGILENPPVNLGLAREVNMDEVRISVRSMKNGKSVGPDGIPVEVWKVLGVDGWKWLTLFFNKLLHEEAIPEEWCNSVLVPIFKGKGDVQDCNSYRGIKLMSHSMKLWERVLERRLREESGISQSQFGFMPGRGTSDAIFALRQLCEKYRRVHKNLHMVFVDLEKAYDRVPREVLWWALKEKGVPGKYVELIRAMYRRSCTYVRSTTGNTDKFNVSVGLHQGSALSPYLFLLIMDAVTADIQGEAPWCMLFADDIVLVGEDGVEVQSRLEKWRQRLERVGLKISRTKTKHMFCDFGGLSSFVPMSLDGVTVPVCSDFRYLGSLLQNDGNVDRDVKQRISSGWMKWRQVTGITCDSKVPLKLKGQIYKQVIRPVVLYGSECWAINGKDERKLHVSEMRMLRWMCGVTRADRIRNEYIRGSMKVAAVTGKVQGKRLALYGHVMRRDDCYVTKRVMNMNVDGWVGRGRPKKRWMDCVKEDMRKKGVNAEMIFDREEWKKNTHCADPK